MADPRTAGARRALVLTVSDRVAAGTRADASGDAMAARLRDLGLEVDRAVLPDEVPAITAALRAAAATHALVVTTGGTGLTPRDVTPQATRAAIDLEVPGLAEAMRAAGRVSSPYADLSRAVVGVVGRTLVINVPGSLRGATESIDAILGVVLHALETLAGPFDHEVSRPAPTGAPSGGAA